MTVIIVVLVIAFLAFGLVAVVHDQKAGIAPVAKSKPSTYVPNPALLCPHCQVRGQVRTQQVKQKKGVSGAKLTGAVFTGGISMLGTGLSRKEKVTEMRCGNCSTVWYV